MNLNDRRGLKAQTKEILSATKPGKKRLFAVHIAVSAVVSFVISLLGYLLQQGGMAATGLDGISTRALLETLEQLLSMAYSLASPFWQIAGCFLALQLLRQAPANGRSLLAGFRRVGPVLRWMLLVMLMLTPLAWVGSTIGLFVGIVVAMFLPSGKIFWEIAMSVPEAATQEQFLAMVEDPAIEDQLMTATIPAMVIMVLLTFVAILPLYYRLRMSQYILMDDANAGARTAIKASFRLTKGSAWALFRLDLSYWWYYGLEFLLSGLYIAGSISQALPLSPLMLFLVCNGGYMVGEILLYSLANPRVQVTYAGAYEALVEKSQKEAALRMQKVVARTILPQ